MGVVAMLVEPYRGMVFWFVPNPDAYIWYKISLNYQKMELWGPSNIRRVISSEMSFWLHDTAIMVTGDVRYVWYSLDCGNHWDNLPSKKRP